MKKAIVVGGSNGIGLAVSKILMEIGYYVVIIDKTLPDIEPMEFDSKYSYIYTDLMNFDRDLFEELSKDDSVEVLMITAGIGRVTAFENIHPIELEKTMQINAVSTIEIIRYFYPLIKSSKNMYSGIVSSISGLINSPLFSIYAASKAAVCRFVESVNIELEVAGVSNRVLNVAPASIAGTKFYGGKNEPSKVEDVAQHIVEKLFSKDTLFIPQYNSIYKSVIERNNQNSHDFGISSYSYKLQSDRYDDNKKGIKVGYLSGTFDLFHVGHLNLLKRAKSYCDFLIVGVHDSGAWKGKDTFIPLEERKQIVAACKFVDKVVDSCREDSDAWRLWNYDYLFVGSDYKGTERFERYEKFFKEKGVKIVYFPYTQSTSSTQIRKTILLKTKDL